VEVRRRMVGEVDRDHDAVEGRDARHPRIVRRAPADGRRYRPNYGPNYRLQVRS
jgi:hypothetical protein